MEAAEKEEEKMILLRLHSNDAEKRTYKVSDQKTITKTFTVERYCLLDLSSNPTEDEDSVLHPMPFLLDSLFQKYASMVVEPKRQTIYLIGGHEPAGDLELIAQFITSQTRTHGFDSDFFAGASRLDFKVLKQTICQSNSKQTEEEEENKCCWVTIVPPPFSNPPWSTLCTALDGCIYNLGSGIEVYDVPYRCSKTQSYIHFESYWEMDDIQSSHLRFMSSRYRKLCKPMVFNPDKGCWVTLDPGVHEGHFVSAPLLPDPVNKRILVHFPKIEGTPHQSSVSRLFAFHPDKPSGQNWLSLACPDDKHPWRFASAVVDNVIYFRTSSKPFVDAYEVASEKWLEVQWSQVPLYNGCDASGDEMEYHFMLLLANGIFCLIANWNSYDDEKTASPFFLKFSFERKGDTVTLTPMCTTVVLIPKTFSVRDCATA